MSNSKIKLVSLLKERNIIEEGVVKNSKAFNIMAYQIIEHISKSSRLKDGVVEDYVNTLCSSKDDSITSLLISSFRSSYSSNMGFYLAAMIDDGEVLGGNPTPDFEEFLDFLDDRDIRLILDFHNPNMGSKGGQVFKGSWEKKNIDLEIKLNMFNVTSAYRLTSQTDICSSSKNVRSTLYNILEYIFVNNPGQEFTLQHELQHLYDDWRSEGRILDTPESREYQEMKHLMNTGNAELDAQLYDMYQLQPHEIWARVQEQVQYLRFQMSDDLIIRTVEDQSFRHSQASKFMDAIFKGVNDTSFKPSDQLKRRLLKVFSQLINLRYEDIKSKLK